MIFGGHCAGGSGVAGTIAIAFVFVTIQSAPARAQDRGKSALRTAIAATVVGHVLDGVSTVVGLRSGRARELNPILGQHPARIIVLKSLFTVPQILAEKGLADHGHPKAARWLGCAAGGFATALAIHNFRTAR